MPDMSLTKYPIPTQDPKERINNFDEVETGYDLQTAMKEAERCLNCKHKPCAVSGCPVHNDIPAFIEQVRLGNIEEAYKILSKTSNLPSICGRVCPQEKQCEKYCVRGIKGQPVAIGRLERFVADWYYENCAQKIEKSTPNGKKVAVVGSGPAGLTCAGDLAKMGYEVTVYEALHTTGGILTYGIPEFILPSKVVEREINVLKDLGVKFVTNAVVGKTITVDDMFAEGFSAVFIGNGSATPKFMGIEGENLNGVYSANEYLMRVNLMNAYDDKYDTPLLHAKKYVVVGGGNVAMDAARCAIRFGSQVTIVYRRSRDELPSRAEEVVHAEEEGIEFKLLTNPVKILADENFFVKGIECVEMTLGEPDESGRRSPVLKPNSNFVIDADCVIMSIGTGSSDLVVASTYGIQTDKKGNIIVDENGMTTRLGVFAGGDAVTGPATVILAMDAGKTAAKGIDNYLRSKQ